MKTKCMTDIAFECFPHTIYWELEEAYGQIFLNRIYDRPEPNRWKNQENKRNRYLRQIKIVMRSNVNKQHFDSLFIFFYSSCFISIVCHMCRAFWLCLDKANKIEIETNIYLYWSGSVCMRAYISKRLRKR